MSWPRSAPLRSRSSEVDDKALQQPAGNFGSLKLSMALYEARRAAIDEIVGEKLIAQESKTRGVTTAALMDQEIGSKIAAVTDADVAGVVQRQPGARAGRDDRSGPRADPVAAHAGAHRHGVSEPTSIS